VVVEIPATDPDAGQLADGCDGLEFARGHIRWLVLTYKAYRRRFT
jgi:hypothetical protein